KLHKLNFPGLGVSASERFSQFKLGNMYYLLPSPTSVGIISPSKSPMETEQACVVKRIKVIITKKQLQELLSKRISLGGDVLSGPEWRICSSDLHSLPSTCWKPKLEPIPE
ncbi:hypothetical protein U1Q18_031849, partial [Sarracenia purpurea var. burkii]